MSQKLQTSGQYATLPLWGSSIHLDKKVVQLKEFSAFLEQRAKKSASDFLLIGQQQKLGWLIVGADYLEKEMRQVCFEVGEYITAHNVLNNPNWELFLQPRILFADAAKQLILNLHETLIQACINNTEEQAQQAYRTSLANSEGLGFGIISNSLTAHFLYAMQAAQKERENEQAAQDAANRVRRNSSPVEKAGELTTKAYHETHEPFVLDSLAQFYGEVESFIYTGADYDKAALDTASKEAADIIATADVENMKSAIVQALQKDVCCGEAVYAAIRNRLVDDNFVRFCEYAPIKLLENSLQPIVGWQKKEKLTNQLYNRPIFSQKTLRDFKTLQLLLSGNNPKTDLYNEILGEVYIDEVNSVFYAISELLQFNSSTLERYACEGKHLDISDSLLDMSILLCNELCCSRLTNMLSGSGLLLPLSREQLTDRIAAANAKIDFRHTEILKARREKAARDAAEKAEKERIEAEARAQKQVEKERKRQRNTKIAKIAAIILTPAIIGILLWNYWLLPNVIQPSRAYSEAEQLLADGYYSDAATVFEALGDYKDSSARLEEIVTYMMDDIYEYGIQLLQEGNYELAIEQFETIVNYKDTSAKIDEANAAILEREYIKAQNLLSEDKYEDAIEILSKISSYKDAQDLIYSAHYHIGIHLLENNHYTNAYKEFELSNNYENCITTARQWLLEKMHYANRVSDSVQGTDDHLVALCSDGTVVSVDGRLVHNEYGENNVAHWSDVVSICADSFLTFGVRSNGTVLATGRDVYGECKVSSWKNISKVFSGFSHTVGLCTDGTVVAVGNNESGQCDVESWTNIVDIETTSSITIGLRSDGKICIAGQDSENDWIYGALEWSNIVHVAADIYQGCMLGLTSDGKVLVVSKDQFNLPSELSDETVIDICVDDAAFFLTESGNVYYVKIADNWYYDDGIEDEQNIIAISADRNHFVGLRADGTVFVTGYHDYSDYDVEDWKDIIAIRAMNRILVGIKADGTILTVGDDSDELDISKWTNIYIPK